MSTYRKVYRKGQVYRKATPKKVEPMVALCEGCDKPLLNETGSKIDSGQIICHDCLRYFRNR